MLDVLSEAHFATSYWVFENFDGSSFKWFCGFSFSCPVIILGLSWVPILVVWKWKCQTHQRMKKLCHNHHGLVFHWCQLCSWEMFSFSLCWVWSRWRKSWRENTAGDKKNTFFGDFIIFHITGRIFIISIIVMGCHCSLCWCFMPCCGNSAAVCCSAYKLVWSVIICIWLGL